MKTIQLISFFLICVLLHSCIVRGPKYTTVEKVLQLKPGITYAETNKLLNSSPYDLNAYDSSGVRSYIYKYRVTDRKTVPFLLKENNGKEFSSKYMDLVAYFSVNDILFKFESKPTDSDLKEKRLNINNLIVFFTVTVPAVFVFLGINKLY